MIHTIPPERLRLQKPAALTKPDAADITINFDNATRLEIVWGDRKVDADRQATRQNVIYRHRKGDGALIDESIEDLNFNWISDKEMQISAQKAGLDMEPTLTSFVDGETGNEMIYIFRKGS